MYIYGRLAKLIVGTMFSPKLSLDTEFRTTIRIWPNDLDFNLHINNGRYLTLFDLGRMDLILRSGLWKYLVRFGWSPVLGTASIRFRRSIGAFIKVHISTRIVYWDEKWLYIEHKLLRAHPDHPNSELIARGVVKVIFRDKKGNISVPQIMKALDLDFPPRPKPSLIETWEAFERELYT